MTGGKFKRSSMFDGTHNSPLLHSDLQRFGPSDHMTDNPHPSFSQCLGVKLFTQLKHLNAPFRKMFLPPDSTTMASYQVLFHLQRMGEVMQSHFLTTLCVININDNSLTDFFSFLLAIVCVPQKLNQNCGRLLSAEENNTDKALMDLMAVQRSISRDDGNLFNVLGIILWLGKCTLSVCTGFCLRVHTLCTSVCTTTF